MGKSKKEKRSAEDDDDVVPEKKMKTEESDQQEQQVSLTELPYDDKLVYCSIIAKPMANRKLAKRLFKLMKKAYKKKTYLRIGLKDVQMRIRKGETGLAVFAGDVTPIEVMCHLPAVCEEKEIPYVYVPLRADISTAIGIKRPALMVLIRHNEDYGDLYAECESELKQLPLPIQ